MTHDHGLHEPKKKESLIVPVLQTLLRSYNRSNWMEKKDLEKY